ncbi:hypothetical protein BHE90_004386 [Fusarium euwallaceae]|uniref:Uncharacterized protein n=1 Tax=Fusarium euwallaceae TaxID=1147111 RepID=A0A430LZB5_9HYPO|nr:hypothetical protein BHE90_004386 [Fusarium euwallaceae]
MPFADIAPDLGIADSPINDSSGDNFGREEDETYFPPCWGSDDSVKGSDDEVVENRPHRSPYASDIVALRFNPNQTLRIPRQFLDKTPLATRLERCGSMNQIDLGSIQFDAGHVIVNFLVTGKYQCLEPWGTTAAGKYSSEFRTALRVYMAAESLGLTELFYLAQEEARKAGDKLSFPHIVDNVHFLDPFHAHFPWIGEYVESRMISFWETTTDEEATKMTSDVLGPSNLHKILIGGLLKLKEYYGSPKEDGTVIKQLEGEIQERRAMLRAVRMRTEIAHEEFSRPEEEIRQKVDLTRYLGEDGDLKRDLDLTQKKLDLRKMKAEKLYSTGSRKEQDQRYLEKPEVAPIQETPALTSKKILKEVEQEAVLEQSELTILEFKRHETRVVPLAFSSAERNRLSLLEQKKDKRAEVLNAKRDWDRIDLQQEKLDTAWKDALHKEGILNEPWRARSSNLTKVILYRALRKKYDDEKLAALARRKAAVERYQYSTPDPENSSQEEIGGSSCSTSAGQWTPESGSGWSTPGLCFDPESHLKAGGKWAICDPCRRLVIETMHDMVVMPDLKVSED